MTSTKVQFLVQMTCDSCVNAVKNCLENLNGVKSFDIDLSNTSVVVETVLPVLEVQSILESTGRSVAIKGFDGSVSAVSILEAGKECVKGVVRFVQATPNTCIIDGTVDGLTPGDHNIEVHECGDLTNGCESTGQLFGVGNLGTITATKDGRSTFRLENNQFRLSEAIGRSFVINSQDERRGESCGIIARSAGLFQNPKTICACDGTTIWEEVSKSKKLNV